MIYPRLNRVRNGQRLSVELVNGLIKRTEYAGDLLRQGKCLAGTDVSIAQRYDGTTISGGGRFRIVGSYIKSGLRVGFVYDGTTYTDIVFPGAPQTTCNDIYNGNIVGGRVLSDNINTRGFVYSNGNYTELESPRVGGTSNARGIYENLITGTYTTSGNLAGGYLYDGSSYRIILPPGAINTFEPKIDQNTIVGRFQTSANTSNRGFITTTDLSSYTTFTVPGAIATNGKGTLLTGVHNDTIIGFYFNASGGTTSFSLLGGNRTDFNYPGASETRFIGIYENFIVGQFESGFFLYDGSTFADIVQPPGVTNFNVFGIG
jgi:hypothetical protein